MKHLNLRMALLVPILAHGLSATAQQSPFVVLYNTSVQSCSCYTFGNGQINQHGSIWNRNMIDLSQNFDFRFRIKMNDENVWNADGMAFILQRDTISYPAAAGTPGQGQIGTSLAVEFDVFQNNPDNDPGSDHLGIFANGSHDHNSVDNLAGPVDALPFNQFLTDGNWHDVYINWDATLTRIRVYIDQEFIPNIQYTGDVVNTIFGGDPMVHWGWAGGCGGVSGIFQVCFDQSIDLNAAATSVCEGQNLTIDQTSTSSLGAIDSVQWNMGNGTVITAPALSYAYPAQGNYTITASAYDLSGCAITQTQTVTILPQPDASFVASDGCVGTPVSISGVMSGSAPYIWTLNGTQVSTIEQPTITSTQIGTNTITLTAGPAGCQDSFSATIDVGATPVADITANNHCFGDTLHVNFIDASGLANATIDVQFGDLQSANQLNPDHIYATGGSYTITATATTSAQCSATATAIVDVWQPNPILGTNSNTITVTNGPFLSYQWYRNDTLMLAATAHDITPTQSGNYTVVVTDDHGCTGTSLAIEFTYTSILENQLIQAFTVISVDGGFIVRGNSLFNQALEVRVVDVAGRTVATRALGRLNGPFSTQLELSGSANGVYLVSIITPSGPLTRLAAKQ